MRINAVIANRLSFIVATVLVVGFIYPCGLSAAPWMSEDFDTYSVGNLIGQGGWTGSQGPAKVGTDFVKSGNSVVASYRLWGTGDAVLDVSSDSGYHYIDFDVAMDVTEPDPPPFPRIGKGDNVGYIRVLSPTGAEITRFYYSKDQLKLLVGPGSQTVIADDVPNQTWYHIRLGINLASSKMDVWVDEVQKLSQVSTYQSATSIGRIVVGQWSATGDKLDKSYTYIDNLTGSLSVSLPPGSAIKLISPTWPWGSWEFHNVCYPFVLYDAEAQHYKMYHTGSATSEISDAITDQWQTGIATSTDTVKWERRDDYEPVLYAHKFYEGDVVDPDDTSAVFDSIFAIGACVMKDGATYKMWYTGWGGDTEHVGGGLTVYTNYMIGYATSDDGIAWTKQAGTAGAGSIFGIGSPGGSLDAKGVGQPHVLKEGANYRMWYEGFDGSHWRVFYATSGDGVNWTRQGLALDRGASGALDELGARNPVVIFRNGQYEMWYQGQLPAAPNYRVLRATSSDGLTWTKTPGEVTLHPDTPTTGSEMIHVDSVIAQPDGSAQVFFAKQNTYTLAVTEGSVQTRRYHIYTEVIP